MTQIETIQHIYASFERGDIPAILERLAEDVEWEYSIAPLNVPWLERRRGRSEVPQFFASMAGFELKKFEPKRFLESGNVVVVMIDVELIVKSTGRRIAEEDEMHVWYFNSQGEVSRYGHKVDTHQHWLACGNG